MKAITIDAARTLNLEAEIGSLEPGKRANFAILGSNPMEVDPMRPKEIEVLGIVYQRTFHQNRDTMNE